MFNNYSKEPKLYYAQYPSQEQQGKSVFPGAVTLLFVTSIVPIALGVS